MRRESARCRIFLAFAGVGVRGILYQKIQFFFGDERIGAGEDDRRVAHRALFLRSYSLFGPSTLSCLTR